MPRVLPLAAAVTVAATLAGAADAGASSSPGPAATQPLVTLTRAHLVRARPRVASAPVTRVADRRPITGIRTVLPVLARRTDARGRAWLRVRLPGRRLGATAPPATGWIVAAGTRASSTPWHVVVRLQGRLVEIFRGGRAVRRVRAVIGKPGTPTPRGSFFVEENVALGSTRAGGPFALALSARSAVLQEFDGGPGQIALHGRDGVGGTLGAAQSHGCVRLASADIAWLAARIVPGVPVTVR